jgi:glycosyltransferase involved in cell wall biosynthesis
LRIALVCQHFNLGGGVARDAYLFAGRLVELGADVHVFGNARTFVRAPGVTFHPVPTRRVSAPPRFAAPVEHGVFAYHATQTVRQCRSDYDVVYVTGAEAWEQDVVRVHAVVKAENRRWPERGGRNLRAARLRQIASLVTGPQNSLERSIQRHQFKAGRFHRLAAVTDEVRDDLCSLFGVSAEQVDVLPCPIDLEAITRATSAGVRELFALSPTDIVLLFVGNDFYRKGLDEAVRVLARLPSDVHLVVVGSGDATPYAQLAETLGAADRVHFAGATASPEGFVIDADIFFLPTREDVWGIALLEAMAAGVPVVTSAAAGASAVVRAAGAGVVVSNYDTDSFVAAVAELVADAQRRRELGARGPAGAEPFDVRRLAPVLASMLEEAARRR